MALYTGYYLLPISSYFAWKTEVNGNGYDADGQYGYQCWDLAAEFWYNVGFPQAYPHTGPNHAAYECWTVNRYNNISYNGVTYFRLIENFYEVKRGDIVVLSNMWSTYGHIAFADEDYNGTNNMAVLGQNQGSGGTPPPIFPSAGGSTANVKTMNIGSYFLGAFRYIPWERPTPTPTLGRGRFPWVLYAQKFRFGER